jgi:hypothetical protein
MAVGAERRLAKVEAALGPKELVVRWLAEAHAYDNFVAYARSTYAQGPAGWPLDRLVHETIDWVDATHRGRSRDERDDPRQTALRQVLFLYHLILRTTVLAQEALDREALIEAACSAHLALATIDNEDGRSSAIPTHVKRLYAIRGLVLARVSEWHAMAVARSRVEAEYFDGRAVLFPAAVRAWSEQLEGTEQLAVMAERLSELDGVDPPSLDDPAAFEARIDELVADHVEPARVKAFDELGEGRRAMSIAMRWLDPKFG